MKYKPLSLKTLSSLKLEMHYIVGLQQHTGCLVSHYLILVSSWWRRSTKFDKKTASCSYQRFDWEISEDNTANLQKSPKKDNDSGNFQHMGQMLKAQQENDGHSILKFYTMKLNSSCKALFQPPR